jgi:hypothetical protein
MTTKGIEAQYEEHERMLSDMRRIVENVTDQVKGEEIPIIVSALLTVAIDAMHQSDMSDEDRFRYIAKMLTAAWQDYYNGMQDHPPTDELH